MLILSRYRDQKIKIGDDVTITIVDVRGDRVRIGVEAPKGTPVHREEVYEEIQSIQRDRETREDWRLAETPDVVTFY